MAAVCYIAMDPEKKKRKFVGNTRRHFADIAKRANRIASGGRASPLDNTITLYGGTIVYTKIPENIENIEGLGDQHILVIETGEEISTREAVKISSDFWDN